MANTYTWGLQSSPLVAKSLDGLTNVVVAVHWNVTATSDQKDPNGNFYTAYRYGGPLALGSPNPDSFTSFNTVTIVMVNGWVQAALGSDQVAALQSGMDAEIAADIAAAANPATPVPMALISQ